MQTNNIANNESTSTVNNASPTQQDNISRGESAPPPTASLGIDSDFLKAIDDFVLELRKCAASSLAWRIQIGINLHEFRDGLGIEDWNYLLHSQRLPFSARTAQTLARIGKHKVLADLKRAHQLPEALTVLNLIASLSPSAVEEGLAAGEICPDTTLAQARKLVARNRAMKSSMPQVTVTSLLI